MCFGDLWVTIKARITKRRPKPAAKRLSASRRPRQPSLRTPKTRGPGSVTVPVPLLALANARGANRKTGRHAGQSCGEARRALVKIQGVALQLGGSNRGALPGGYAETGGVFPNNESFLLPPKLFSEVGVGRR